MQQRLCLGGRVEIPGGGGEVDVRDRTDRAYQALGIVLEFDGQAVEIGESAGDEEHHEQRRQDSQHPALVEIRQRERSLAEVAIDHAADQIARYHEEDIDPDEAARKAGNAGVVEQHGNDGERAQPVDVGAVFHRSNLEARDGAVNLPAAAAAADGVRAVAKADTPDISTVPKRPDLAGITPRATTSRPNSDGIFMRQRSLLSPVPGLHQCNIRSSAT